jgi:pentatricopeptide repeat protein
MNAYILSDKATKALTAFEAAVGLKADGSPGATEAKIVGRKSNTEGIVSSLVGVNMCTATDVIRAHAQLGDGVAARRVVAEMEGTSLTINGIPSHSWGVNLKADTKCYNAVLSAVVNSNDIKAAEDLFEKMQAKKDLVSFNTMIGAYARAGMRQEAYNLFKTMKTFGIKPDKVTITALIKAVLAEDDFTSARQLLKDMKKAGIGADVITYNTVIQALCAKSKWFEAKELVAEMEANGISPNSKTYGLLMNGLLKLNKPGPCLTLFESACADQRTAGLMENAHLYTTAITAAASLGDSERAFELLSRMNFAGVKPNLKTLTALMGACISDNKFSYALDLYKKMKYPDGYAQSLAIRAHCGVGDFGAALNMIQNKEQLSGKQTMKSYNYIKGSALNKRDFTSAFMALVSACFSVDFIFIKKSTNVVTQLTSITLLLQDDLLKRGFIPSKETLQVIVKTLGLFEKKQSISSQNDESDNSAFVFLINVLDACNKRKLQISGQFYAGVLVEGARLGGLERKIASMISTAKTDVSREDVHFEDAVVNSETIRQVSWSELLLQYNHLKDQLEVIKLPSIRVQITDRELRRQVLSAERAVSYSRRIGRRAKSQV